MSEAVAQLQKEVIASEGCLVGVFWNNPDYYNFYPEEQLNSKTFLNEVYGFYFSLGRYMSNKGIRVFDDISASRVVSEAKVTKRYEQYGGFEVVQELMDETKSKEENIEAYYSDIKKYYLLKNLVGLFGDKVIQKQDKYDYRRMDKEQLYTYWNDKIVQVGLDGDNKYDEHYLLDDLDEMIEEMDNNPAVGLPFYDSKKMTNICTGWDYGHVYIYGGFGGSGKTSFTFNKVIMSCIKEKEKLLVIANEQSISEFKKMLFVTAMGLSDIKPMPRQRLNEGGFTQEEREKLKAAKEWIHELCEGDNKLITFVFMDNYIIDDVKKLIRHYAARGISRVIIDTGKPSEGSANMARWERFTEDFKEIYKLARPNGGGLNLAIWVNVQLADSALKTRFLNEHSLGEAKKIKNEASVMFLGRFAWDDEMEGGSKELKITRYVPDEFMGGYKDIEEPLPREKGSQYFLLFTSKNRRGQDNKTGQRVLVLKPNFNSNLWKEIGWTTVYDDHNY